MIVTYQQNQEDIWISLDNIHQATYITLHVFNLTMVDIKMCKPTFQDAVTKSVCQLWIVEEKLQN